MQTLDWLAHRARISAGHVALIQGERQWSYRELDQAVAEYAARLAAAGVRAGQHVAVLMPNRFEYVCLIHALARIGVALVPLNIRLAEPELLGRHDQLVARLQIVCYFLQLLAAKDALSYIMAHTDHTNRLFRIVCFIIRFIYEIEVQYLGHT